MITSDNVDLLYLSALLSSKTLNFVFRLLGSTLGQSGYELRKIYVEQLPIALPTEKIQKTIIRMAEKKFENVRALRNEIYDFKIELSHKWNIIKFSKKIDNYYELSFEEFIAELKKKKVIINDNNVNILKKSFEKSSNQIRVLNYNIEKIEKELDNTVYKIYGLTDEEIEIVENKIKN